MLRITRCGEAYPLQFMFMLSRARSVSFRLQQPKKSHASLSQTASPSSPGRSILHRLAVHPLGDSHSSALARRQWPSERPSKGSVGRTQASSSPARWATRPPLAWQHGTGRSPEWGKPSCSGRLCPPRARRRTQQSRGVGGGVLVTITTKRASLGCRHPWHPIPRLETHSTPQASRRHAAQIAIRPILAVASPAPAVTTHRYHLRPRQQGRRDNRPTPINKADQVTWQAIEEVPECLHHRQAFRIIGR